MDQLTPEHRSWNMSRIRSRNTKPELAVRSLVHRMGYRFRVNRTDLPGKPDIVLPKHRSVIFVHGCFWHRHEDCEYAYMPKTKRSFWKKKFTRNTERDQEVQQQLQDLEWRVLVVWECEIGDLKSLAARIEDFLKA